MINIFHNGLKKKIQGNADSSGGASSTGYEYVICEQDDTYQTALNKLFLKMDQSKITANSTIVPFLHRSGSVNMPKRFHRLDEIEAITGNIQDPQRNYVFKRTGGNYNNIEPMSDSYFVVHHRDSMYIIDDHTDMSNILADNNGTSALILFYDGTYGTEAAFNEMADLFARI